jgi:hypothetical protein
MNSERPQAVDGILTGSDEGEQVVRGRRSQRILTEPPQLEATMGNQAGRAGPQRRLAARPTWR